MGREVTQEMKAELRADGKLYITGYVNVPGRESRPVMTPRGRVNEIIEPRAFAEALDEADDIVMLIDHDRNHQVASRNDGSLNVKEDQIGLRAEAVVEDESTKAAAMNGELRGWSFNIIDPVDEVEERANRLPLRRIKKLKMNEISLIIHKVPVYSATMVEVRGEDEMTVEYRGIEEDSQFTMQEQPKMPEKSDPKPDYTEKYNNRINALRL
jgi:hypothetical protein